MLLRPCCLFICSVQDLNLHVCVTYLSGGMPSKPQKARFQANMATCSPAAAPAIRYSRLPAHAESLCACLSSAVVQMALLGTLRGSWRATNKSTGISLRGMTKRLPLVLATSAGRQQADNMHQ